MEKLNYEKILGELLTNKRIVERVKALRLKREQVLEALPILMDMHDQDQKPIENNHYLISFYVTETGSVKRMEVLSPLGQKKAYLNNLVTKNIYPLNLEENKRLKNQESRALVVNWVGNFLKDLKNQKQGMYLYGTHGVGKTFIFKKIVKVLAQKNHQVGYVLLPDLVNFIKKSFNNYDEYENIKKVLKDVPYLFIDDIGSETVSPWFRDEFLWLILNYRFENEKITFFSSNYNLDELVNIEARTQNQAYRDIEKSKRLIAKIKLLSTPFWLKN